MFAMFKVDTAVEGRMTHTGGVIFLLILVTVSHICIRKLLGYMIKT